MGYALGLQFAIDQPNASQPVRVATYALASHQDLTETPGTFSGSPALTLCALLSRLQDTQCAVFSRLSREILLFSKALTVPGVVPCSGDKPFTVSGVFQFTPFSSVGLSGEP